MSLFKQYLEEVNVGRHCIEIDDAAFVHYSLHENEELYIDDMYIAPGARSLGMCRLLIGLIEREAKLHKCKIVSYHVQKLNKGAGLIIEKSAAFGFKLIKQDEKEFTFIKEI